MEAEMQSVDGGKFQWDKERYPAMKEYSKYGKFAYTARLRNDVWRNMGGCLAPMNAYLNILGLETLGIRMKALCNNALTLAKALEKLPGITVNYPGLESSPYKTLVDEQFGGLGGAILTIRAGSRENAFKLINSLKYALIATNIGDLRTLVIHAASTIYLHSTQEEQEQESVMFMSMPKQTLIKRWESSRMPKQAVQVFVMRKKSYSFTVQLLKSSCHYYRKS